MKKIIWIPIVVAAVVLSIALGMRLGSGAKPPVAVTQTGGNGDSPSGSLGGGSADPGGPGADGQDRRPKQPTVMFKLEPSEPESGTPVMLIDETEVAPEDSILVSEWRVEGSGLTVPALLSGEEAEFEFPQGGLYRIGHRLHLKEGGLTDWVTQAVIVAQGPEKPDEQDAPAGKPLQILETVTDAKGAIDIWIEDEQVRFRVNSAALDETKDGLMTNFEAHVTYVNGLTSRIGPASYRMDVPLVAGPELGAVTSLSVSGTLPSGRQWEQIFHIR